MMRKPRLLVALALTLAFAAFATRPGRAGEGKPGCADLTVDREIAIERDEGPGGREDEEARVSFRITILVENRCNDPVRVLPGSFASYRTNFPAEANGGLDPPECSGREFGFHGTVPPMRKFPFVFRVEGCRYPASRAERASVSIEGGRIVTESAQVPIPRGMQVLP